ncbi:MAG TPA: sulfite exporter TauE/SafE family protein [Bacteroidia bacterium]|nr:sulfite exporter TauE/SafE family protein [Bacteroidia bacterium]
MTEYFTIAIISLFASGLTLFSGFGLGTILTPVFALFFPIELAIALTAIVHFLNNIFKLVLLGKNADKAVVLRFGIPAILAAFLGAYVLTLLAGLQPLFQYTLSGKTLAVTPVKLTIALLLAFFSLFDIVPKLSGLQFSRKLLPVGGLLSGFFGGLAGTQGALRSAFLVRAGLTKETFVATGVVIACLIDISRLTIYSKQIAENGDRFDYTLVTVATLSAFAGAYIGSKLLKKVTIVTLQYIVAVMLLIFSVLLGAGII